MPLDVYVDAGGRQLAAYQFELEVIAGDVKIVGVEGGDHQAFAEPPYYDPRALKGGRIIIAAFNIKAELPATKVKVARLHVMISGAVEPQYRIKLQTTADRDGNKVQGEITIETGEIK